MTFNEGDRVRGTASGRTGTVEDIYEDRSISVKFDGFGKAERTPIFLLEKVNKNDFENLFKEGDRVKSLYSGKHGTVKRVRRYSVEILFDNNVNSDIVYNDTYLQKIDNDDFYETVRSTLLNNVSPYATDDEYATVSFKMTVGEMRKIARGMQKERDGKY